jgi:hypothetical protein
VVSNPAYVMNDRPLCLLRVVYVATCAAGWSLVHRSATRVCVCVCVCVCVISTMTWPRPNLGYNEKKNKKSNISAEGITGNSNSRSDLFRSDLELAIFLASSDSATTAFEKFYVPSVGHMTGGGEGLILGSLWLS